MLDIEFLQAPSSGPRLVYVYRSGHLRRAMAEAIELLAKANGLPTIRHLPQSFGAALVGLFHGFHWTDLGDVKSSVISGGSASHAVARLEIDPLRDAAERQGRNRAAERQVDEVRRLVFHQGLWLGRRAVILDGVDKVRKQALDPLLKAIEEAPTSVSFVFLAQRRNHVPAAMRSRSSAIGIKPAV